jgi:hypothetical protein
VERAYAPEFNGTRRLVQVTEGETQTLPDGVVKAVRTTSTPDEYGTLQLARKDVEVKNQISPNVQEGTTSVFTPEDRTLKESVRIERRETRHGHTIEFQETSLVPDLSGGWQTREVRQGLVKDDSAQRYKEQTVLRPDSYGKMSVEQRTTTKETTTPGGEMQAIKETYSVDLTGFTRDGKLHLIERVATIVRHDQDGQSTQVTVENADSDSPGGMRLTGQTLDVVVRGSDGIAHETRTLKTPDGSGNLRVAGVDVGTSNKAEQ